MTRSRFILGLSLFCFVGAILCAPSIAQEESFKAVKAEVDFDDQIREWDGFGFNYVETSQTYNYETNPQDYGGFKFLSEKDREAIVDLVFGDDGLQPGLVKMFLDPLHQAGPGAGYDHKTTTGHMRYFVKEGLKLTRERGEDFSIVTTLYAPPAYITQQNVMRGRDLHPDHKEDLANYMIHWVKFLKEEEKLPVKYLSLHNEGESWLRWPQDGTTGGALDEGHDYNLFWDPEQTVEMLKLMRPLMDAAGLEDVGLTPGEYTNWYRFYHWGFARALAESEEALDNLGIITSHGFYVGGIHTGRWFGPHTSVGNDLVRSKRPEMRSWVTSTAWNVKDDSGPERLYVMDAHLLKEIHGNIYDAKVNGLITWAGIQSHTQWWKPDPNPGTAIRVYEDGTYEVKKGYYLYKQVTRAGKPGMAVAYTSAMDSEFSLIAFASNNTSNADAFVVTHTGREDRRIVVTVKGGSDTFQAYRTTGKEVYQKRDTARRPNDGSDNYADIGEFEVVDGKLVYDAPAGSVTTFFAR